MPGGALRLSDFWDGTIVDDGSEGIQADYSGLPPGDLRYTAPEILACLHDADPGIAKIGDLFSLGACAFEMLTGVPLGVQIFEIVQELATTMASVEELDEIDDQFVSNI